MSDTKAAVPPLTLGWRLRMALEWAEIDINDMAAQLEVSRSTVSRWVHDRGAPPKAPFLTAWAAYCGVAVEWLRYDEPEPVDAMLDRRNLLRGRDSNSQPNGYPPLTALRAAA